MSGCLWWARLAAIILFWKMVCSGSFVAPDLGWCVVRVRVIERLLLAVSLDCRWIKRTMAVENAAVHVAAMASMPVAEGLSKPSCNAIIALLSTMIVFPDPPGNVPATILPCIPMHEEAMVRWVAQRIKNSLFPDLHIALV